ncbi:MAG: hypothetical protein M3Z85_02345 [Acidobacteriota bacterium]|nr:hypothetical protein [Acidobacteriota bacterium]
MNIKLHIERLVLEGVPFASAESPRIRAAVEAELTRLLTARGIAPGLTQGGAFARAPGGSIPLTPEGKPETLGTRIAQAVYGGLQQ